MSSLKQEMRQLFDSRTGTNPYETDPLREEGLLEKIITLAFLNLHVFDNHNWNISAIESKVDLQKLYRLVRDPVIPEASAVLLVSGGAETSAEEDRARDLLSMSLMYAAKYYFVDFHIVREFDGKSILREFAITRPDRLSALICLGRFDTCDNPLAIRSKWAFSDVVRVF